MPFIKVVILLFKLSFSSSFAEILVFKNCTNKDYSFEIGKSIKLKEGKDVTIFAAGACVHSSLEAAKKLGHKLVVGINSDTSVRKLKGSDRPINSLDQRMAIIQALGCVDWVVSFSEETPLSLIKYLKPDILVKGADYKAQDIVGSDEVLANGGEVKTIALIKGLSSTDKIKKMRSKT